MQFRDLNAQYEALKDDMDAAILEVVKSGCYIGGPQVAELEERLASYVGVKHCITCANGTDALQLALMAWGVGPGDAVFVPDFTFFSSGEVVSAVGATPVFVDVDGDSFNINPMRLEEAIRAIDNEGVLIPRVVISVDLFGLPADYPAIKEICKEHQLLLLEDGAQGFGGSVESMRACSFGDISTTSFFPAKPLGCYGDGGAVFTDNEEWAFLIRSYAIHGKGAMKYDNVRIGMNSRLDTIQAAVLIEKLDAFERFELDAVNMVADLYDDALSECELILPRRYRNQISSWAQYTIQIPSDGARCRDALRAYLADNGIPSMVYYPKPMHLQLAFTDKSSSIGIYDVTRRLCETVLSLPMGPYMTSGDIVRVSDTIKQFLK